MKSTAAQPLISSQSQWQETCPGTFAQDHAMKMSTAQIVRFLCRRHSKTVPHCPLNVSSKHICYAGVIANTSLKLFFDSAFAVPVEQQRHRPDFFVPVSRTPFLMNPHNILESSSNVNMFVFIVFWYMFATPV